MSQPLKKLSETKLGGLRILVWAGLLSCLSASVTPLTAQTEDANAPVVDRKVITRIEPNYPPTLERLYIGGVVRLQVDIAPNGSVESAQLIGGNPILGQSAIAAVKQWKYTPAKTKTRTIERLEFDPHK